MRIDNTAPEGLAIEKNLGNKVRAPYFAADATHCGGVVDGSAPIAPIFGVTGALGRRSAAAGERASCRFRIPEAGAHPLRQLLRATAKREVLSNSLFSGPHRDIL